MLVFLPIYLVLGY